MTDLHASVRPWNGRWRALVYDGPDCTTQIRGSEAYVRALSDKMVGGASHHEIQAFLVGVSITTGQPVANDNDPSLTLQAVWYSEVEMALVQRAKERRDGEACK